MSQTPARPWDQLPEEPSPAYLAFSYYRDLGPGRTMIAAARALAEARPGQFNPESGPDGASSGQSGPVQHVPGAWKRWFRDHHWADRATAYDTVRTQARDRGQEKAIEAAAEDFLALAAREQKAEIEARLEDAKLLRRQGRMKVALPVRDTELPEKDAQGRTVTYKAAPPQVGAAGRRDMVAAAGLADSALALARSAGQSSGIAPGPVMLDDAAIDERVDHDEHEWMQSMEKLLTASSGVAEIRRGSSASSESSTTLRVSAAG